MTLPPLIERELRSALRKKTAKLRVWTAVIGVGITVFHVLFEGRSGASGSQNLFHILLLLSSGKAVFETAHFSLDLIASERRNGTLGLLMLTGLSGGEIFASKLAGVLMIQLSSGLALLPCFAVSFLLGGVPGSAFLATAVLIPNLTFLTLALCLAASTLARDEDGAMVAAGAVGCVIALAGPAVYYAAIWIAPVGAGWLQISPLYGVMLIWDLFKTATFPQFWLNSGITFGYSLALAAAAAWLLERTWREGPDAAEFLSFWPMAGRQLARLAIRSHPYDPRWLSPNPFVWLAMRDKQSLSLAWVAVILSATVWFIGFVLWPRTWGAPLTTILAALALNGIVGIMAMFSAAKRVSEDRRSGALELLLTTPLEVKQILQGQRQALRNEFRSLLLTVLVMNAVLAGVAIAARPLWDILALTAFLECWCVVGCLVKFCLGSSTVSLVMWAALNSGRPLFVIRKVVCPPMTLVAIGYFGYSLGKRGLMDFPTGSYDELWVITGILAIAIVLAVFASLGGEDGHARRLRKNFRFIAEQPVPDPSDPRFRKWDPAKPFPEPRPFF